MENVSTHVLSTSRTALVFFAVLGVGLAVQIVFWLTFPVADENWWATDAAKIAVGTPLTSEDVTYVHPGTTIIYPMAGLIYEGANPRTAVRIVMAEFAAICIAIVSALAYILRPQSLWWLATALILVPDLRLLHGTPPSTAAALLTVVFVLLLLYAGKTRHLGGYKPMLYLGICSGFLLATRVDTGAFLLATSLPFLVYMFRQRVLVLFLTTMLTLFALDPYMWTDPVAYLSSIPEQMFANKALVGIEILIPFLLTFPFAILSVAVSLIVVCRQFFRPGDSEARVPLDVYFWFLGATALFTALLAPLAFHPIRYFMPFYLAWDILLPLWLFILARQYRPLSWAHWLTERRYEWALICFIMLVTVVRLVIFLNADTREIIL
ncbi:hypothetical protein HY971_02285 [Candidatus Kaiserbacteria bacterium]|nr:hypothetical protein [Candidatus Kaiserbacteria bacterium]